MPSDYPAEVRYGDADHNWAPEGLLAEQPGQAPAADVRGLLRFLSAKDLDRVHGVVVGAAIGDALGAPFEFGEPGAFTARFPQRGGVAGNEMVGGGRFDWEAGEFTDDTQMAVLEAQSIVARLGIDELDIFGRFRSWLDSGPRGVGGLTRTVLRDPAGWPDAVRSYCLRRPDRSSGNGSVMRASFAAARWSYANELGTMEVARRLSVVTHGDPGACEGRALFHQLVASAMKYGTLREVTVFGRTLDPVARALDRLKIDQAQRYRDLLGEQPDESVPNGTAWGCLRDAFRAVDRSDDFEDCMRLACDVGGDVDTVAAVAGAIAGGLYGLAGIPSRWVGAVHGTVLGERFDADRLRDLATELLYVDEPRSQRPIGWQPSMTAVRYGPAEFFDLGSADVR